MFRRIVVPGIALTIAHYLIVVVCSGVHLGVARAVRDTAEREPLTLRILTAVGDLLMMPTSLILWLSRGARFPTTIDALVFTSLIWGFGVALYLKRRNRR